MRKSNKKVKNDRINSMRKQYDAFLEEDKKRKERNEYIISKLDKMRSSTALLPLSTKLTYSSEYTSPDMYLHSYKMRPKSISDNKLHNLEHKNMISKKLINEPSILKEISKKYILIPKQITPLVNDYVCNQDEVDHDHNWKRKYDILNDLKKQVIEGDHNALNVNRLCENNDKENNINYGEMKYDVEKIKLNELVSNQNNNVNFPEELKTLEKHRETILPSQTNYTQNEDLEVIETNTIDLVAENIPYNISHKENEQTDANKQTTKCIIQEDVSHMTDRSIEKQLDYQENGQKPENDQLLVEKSKYFSSDIDTKSTNSTNNFVLQELDTDKISVESSYKNYNEVVSNRNESEIHDLPSTQKEKPYSNTDPGTPGSQTGSNQIQNIHEETHNYETSEITVPDELENVDRPEHVEYESEINAFETEQNEMFNSEQTGQNTYSYNQGDGKTGEHSSDSYVQNDQYAYYEGVQQEQAYITNVNEHEESTERYDPHYNEQYNQQADNTEYENTNTYEQQQFHGESYENSQLENMVNYDNQQLETNSYQQEDGNIEVQENVLSEDNQMYNQLLYTEQSDIQDHIEKQLIVEEGYTENSLDDNKEGNLQGNEGEQVMDMNIVDQVPDTNLS